MTLDVPKPEMDGDRPVPKKVLIVEDNDLNMKLFNDLLVAHGYGTLQTKDGIEALALAHERLACSGIAPESGIGQFGFNAGEFPAEAGRVKDTPAGRAPGRAREHKRIRDHSTPYLLFRPDLI